ncbi:YceI family protein [Emticicia sp. W12TSBA100-4]|uniref:YceI family protein n=1 Tax=Emticicia sp. W12TSBA100-4 TaxID=3160965 RepID=UPI0033067454
MKLTYSCLVLSLISFFGVAQQQDVSKIFADKSVSKVIYAMKHPMHDWEGVSKDVNAVIVYNKATKSVDQVVVSLKVESFDSGNSNRDSHALEVLEGLKFSKVTFVSTKIKPNGNALSIDGNLTFHGVTKPITITVNRNDVANKIAFDGKFDVLLSDYKVDRPSLFGVKTEDFINLKFNLSFNIK